MELGDVNLIVIEPENISVGDIDTIVIPDVKFGDVDSVVIDNDRYDVKFGNIT